MSIWNWLVDAVTGRSAQPPARSGAARGPSAARSSSVATLDPPEEADGFLPEDGSAPWFAPEGATRTEPHPVPEVERTHEFRALENMLFNKLGGGDLTLPRLARVPEAVLARLRNPDCNLGEVAEVISEDQATATRVLQAANSPIWGAQKVTSIPSAVVRLGINPLRTIMMSESLRAAMFIAEKGNQKLATILWRRALASACIMRDLAGFVGAHPEDAFLLGLLHDVGAMIVLRYVGTYERTTRSRVSTEAFEYVSHEYHQELGELVAEKWELPTEIKELTRNHHTYPAEDDPLRQQRLLLILTGMINQMLGYAPAVDYDLLHARPVCDLCLADREDFIQLLHRLPGEVEERIHAL